MSDEKDNMSGSRNKIFSKNRAFAVSIACTVVDGLLDGCNFILIYLVVQGVFSGGFSLSAVSRITIAIMVVFALRVVIFGYGYVQGQLGGTQVSHDIRLYLGDKIKRIPLARFTERESGDYLGALTVNVNDYEQILTHKTGNIVKNVTLAVVLSAFVCMLFAPAGVVVAAMFLLDVPGLAYAWHQVRRYGPQKSALQASNTSMLVEHIEGMQTLRSYGIGGVRNERIVKSMRAFSDVSYRYEAAVTPPGALVMVLVGLGLPALILLCGQTVLAGELDAVSAVLICMLPLFVSKLSNAIFVDLTAYRNLKIAKDRIVSVVEQPEETGSKEPLKVGDGCVELSHVRFGYRDDEPLFESLDLRFEGGALTALVGDSGCGKSTILSLVAQYYRPDSGEVLIDGTPTGSFDPESVLAHISIVDQNVFLFDDSVMSNVRYARPDATDDEVCRACRLAHADEFICALPQGYESLIGENGNKLSGGERQRLSIARAILRDAPIVLLDEATASLDIENELAVKEAIANLLSKKKTVVMVAHTLPIVRDADRIVVIDGGRAAEAGTHDELMAAGGKYAAMWQADQQLV